MQRPGFIILLLLFLLPAAALAQEGSGQFCIRSFEDRNGNGLYDAGEPLITSGITASLLNADNIIIQTQQLDTSPLAAQGFICFQRLSAGQYSVQISSPDYTATTTTLFTSVVTANSIQTFDFGGTLNIVETVPGTLVTAAEEAENRARLERMFFGVLGALIVGGAMLVIGAAVYTLVYRPRLLRSLRLATGTGGFPAVRVATGQYPAYSRPPSTGSGSMPPVRAAAPPPAVPDIFPTSDSGEYPVVADDDDTGQHPRVDDDTGQHPPV